MTGLARRPRRIIAIDGPAASGKSTTAAAVARRLDFAHLNSGLLYRAYTWRTLAEAWDEAAEDYPARIESVDIEFVESQGRFELAVDGDMPGAALHGQDVAERVSSVASVGCVRSAVFERLRAVARQVDLVCDGRDIGTTVFPAADLKIFLVADAAERARRRLLDLDGATDAAAIEAETARLLRRDEADASRELSPLRKADDAIEIDTTKLNPAEVVDRIVGLAAARGIGPRGGAPPGP